MKIFASMKNKSKYLMVAATIMLSLPAAKVKAQTIIPENYVTVDSVVYMPASVVDQSLADKNIYDVLGSSVTVNESNGVKNAMNAHFENNKSRQINGFRVRIFFGNKQNARTESENTMKEFTSRHHDVMAYRSYENPYFKVTVGDFRTRSEAMQLLQRIQGEFPASFIVKENINYPPVDKERSFLTDTLKVARKIK